MCVEMTIAGHGTKSQPSWTSLSPTRVLEVVVTGASVEIVAIMTQWQKYVSQ